MKPGTIDEHINRLNNKEDVGILKEPISQFVDYVKIPHARQGRPPYDFYFIKDNEGIYVAAVLDMGYQDLHGYVKPEHRKKGHLTKALKECILPHLFKDRDKQLVTINKDDIGEENAKSSLNVAKHLGFTPTEEGDFILYGPTANK